MLSEEHLQEIWDTPNFVMTGQAMAGLVSEIRALRKIYEAIKEHLDQSGYPDEWSFEPLDKAIVAYESGEGEKS